MYSFIVGAVFGLSLAVAADELRHTWLAKPVAAEVPSSSYTDCRQTGNARQYTCKNPNGSVVLVLITRR